jgi:hypothetical protein
MWRCIRCVAADGERDQPGHEGDATQRLSAGVNLLGAADGCSGQTPGPGEDGPAGVTVDASHLYWTNTGTNGTINVANLDGSSPRVLVGGQNPPVGVAVTSTHVYWVNPNSGTINRAGLDGSDPQAIVTGQDFPYGVAVDASFLYWVNRGDNTVHLANLDGSNPQTLGSGQGAWGLAVSPVVRVV